MLKQVRSAAIGAIHLMEDQRRPGHLAAREKLEASLTKHHVPEFASTGTGAHLGTAHLTGETPVPTPTMTALLSMPLENVQLLEARAALQLRERLRTQLDPFSADNAAHTRAWLLPENVRQRYARLFAQAATNVPSASAPVWSFTGLVRDGLSAAANGQPGTAAQRFKSALTHLNGLRQTADEANYLTEHSWLKLVELVPEGAQSLRPSGVAHVQELQDSLLKLMALSTNADRLINGAVTPGRADAARSFEAERSLAVRYGSDTVTRLMALQHEVDKHLSNLTPPSEPELWTV